MFNHTASKFIAFSFGIIFLFSFSACSAKVKTAPEFKDKKIKTLAVLPTPYNSKISREKIDGLSESLKSALKNAGFEVLADKVVREVCGSDEQCSNRNLLIKKYLVDALVKFDVESVRRVNLIAAYYNSISGKLTLLDENGLALIEIEKSQRERGGLLFSTGQLIQGIISQVNNTEKDSFENLSNKFTEDIVSKLPAPATTQVSADATVIDIQNVSLNSLKANTFEVCAQATSGSLLSIILNGQKSNLRETAPGLYCGIYFLEQSLLTQKSVKVEARSPFGNSVRKEIDISNEVDLCDISEAAVLKQVKGQNTIEVACLQSDVGSKQTCQNKIVSCANHKILVFKGLDLSGPYKKVGELKSSSWTDKEKSGSAYYNLVSVNKAGIWSTPVSVKGNDE